MDEWKSLSNEFDQIENQQIEHLLADGTKLNLYTTIEDTVYGLQKITSPAKEMNEIFDICEEVGFTIEHKEFINDTLYIPTSNSTCPLTYKNMFFVLRNGKK